jgi:hypothetical protein
MACKDLASFFCMLASMLALAPASAQLPSADALRLEAANEYVAVFRDNGLVPILLPRGHAPGDVVAASGEMLSRRSDCFAVLDLRDEPSRLPNVELSWSAAARFTLGADQLAEAAARGNAEHIVKVRFEGVRALTASRRQLQRQVRAAACPDLARALRDNAIPAQDWLLIGEVLVATPIVQVLRAKGGGASLSFLSGLTQRFGFKARAEGGTDLARAEAAELRSDKPVPIAFRPSMVLVTPELAQRYRAAKPDQPTLEPFNPQDEAHRAVLDAWVARQAAEMR